MAQKPTDDAAKKTKLAKKSTQPTMLRTDQEAPEPAAAPTDDDVIEAEAADAEEVVDAELAEEVVEAEVADSGVVEAEAVAAEDDADVLAAEAEAVEAEPEVPETPVRAEAADFAELVDDIARPGHEEGEEAVGGDFESPGSESSIRLPAKTPSAAEATETFDLESRPAAELEQTVAMDNAADDQSSAVDLGGQLQPRKSPSRAGVDEVAEALESGVKLEADVGPIERKSTESSVEFNDLYTDEHDKARPSDKSPRATSTEPDVALDEEAALSETTSEVAEPAEEDAVAEVATPAAKKKAKQPPPEPDDEALADEDSDRETGKAPLRSQRGPDKVTAPRRGRGRLLIGTMVGLLVGLGGIVGVRYYDPNLLEDAFGHLPNAPKPTPPPDPRVQATITTLRSDIDKIATEKEELQKSHDAKLEEIKTLNAAIAVLKESDAAVAELRSLLAKRMLVDDKAAAGDLPKAVTQALGALEQRDTLLVTLEKELQKAKLLGDKDRLDAAAFGKVVKDFIDQQAALADVNKALEDAQVKEPGRKGIELLAAAKNDLEVKYRAIGKLLAGEKKSEDAKGLQELLAERNQLKTRHDELDVAIKAAYKELAEAKLAPASGDATKDLVAGVKTARGRAESPLAAPLAGLAQQLAGVGDSSARVVAGIFDSAALVGKLGYYVGREVLIQSPQQRLDADLLLVRDRSQTDSAKLNAALRNAEWVLSKEAQAPPEIRAKAHAVVGLVLRNQKKYPQAKEALSQAVAVGKGDWLAPVQDALAELNDPAAYWLPRVAQLQTTGHAKAAQAELSAALQVAPTDSRLLVQRGLLKLDEARSLGNVAAMQAAIRQDAESALKDAKAAAEASYLLGLLAEELGNFDEAVKRFRQALQDHRGSDEAAARYRIALARVLLRDRDTFVAPPPSAPKPAPKKPVDAAKVGAGGKTDAFPLALLLLFAAADDDDEHAKAEEARIRESLDLAKQLTQSADPKIRGEGYMLMGIALSKLGNRNEGLLTYVKGLKLRSPGQAANDLERLLKEHPAFQQPDATKPPSAYLAEVHFGKGLHLYWAGRYPEAEDHFRQAIGFYSQDARYQYFLGLAQMAQKSKVKRDAANFAFEQGARLEAANRPPTAEIDAALERVQGDLRRTINGYRLKAIELRD
ncbi:MAG: hypothetical protein NZO58_04665 [Gemmataceae bacterium]|nr:hypothetical protein [Gemmataceae bacterium]